MGKRESSSVLTQGCPKCDALKSSKRCRASHTCPRARGHKGTSEQLDADEQSETTSLSGGEVHEEAETDETLQAQLDLLASEADNFAALASSKSSELQQLQTDIEELFTNIEGTVERMRSKEPESKRTRKNFAGMFGMLLNFQSQVFAGQGRKRK